MAIIVLLTILPRDPVPEQDWIAFYNTRPQVYLPMVQNAATTMGINIQTTSVNSSRMLQGDHPVRVQMFWDQIEPQPGQYRWKPYDEKIAALDGHPLLLNLSNSPTWARLYSDWVCSPPREEYYPQFIRLMELIIERYEPYAVEVWNEPDVDHRDIPPETWYLGCWGALGGLEYGQFVARVAREFRATHPEVLIVGGSFMLHDNDFQRGFVRDAFNAADRFVSAWSYHSYPYYHRTDNTAWNMPIDTARWMQQYTDKPVWLTETSLLCKDEWRICDSRFEDAKARYLRYIRNHMAGEGVLSVFWFELQNSWNNCALIVSYGNALPAYDEFYR